MIVEISSSERALRIVVLPALSSPNTRILASLSSLLSVLSKLRSPIFDFNSINFIIIRIQMDHFEFLNKFTASK